MALSVQEQEIHINSSRDQDFCDMYVSDNTWITKMDKRVARSNGLIKVVAEDEISKTYRFPKRLLCIRTSIVSRELSEEEKQLRAERLSAARQKKQT